MEITVVQPDTSTPEGAARTIEQLATTQRQLAEQGRELNEQLGTKVDDLTTSIRTLREEQIATARAAEQFRGTDADLGVYVRSADSRAVKDIGVMSRDDALNCRSPRDSRPYLAGDNGSAVLLRGYEARDGGATFGLLDDPAPRTEWQRKLQRLVETRAFVRSVLGTRRGTPICDEMVHDHLRSAPGPLARIFSDSAGIGAEWIIDTAMPELERELRLARQVTGLFGEFVIGAGGSAISPFLSTGLRPYLAGAPTSDDPAAFTASSLSTAQRTATAVKMAVRMQVDRDASEDALINFDQVGRAELVAALTDGIEDATINGDTASTHQDAIASWDPRSRWGSTGLGGSGDHRRSWTGLRARAEDVNSSSDGSGAETYAGLMAQIAAMDAPHGLGSVAAIVSPEYYLLKMLNFSEILTADKAGLDAATIRTGTLARLGPARVVVSEFVTADLAATGLYTGTGAKTGVLVVNTDRFKMGVRRMGRLEQQADITRDAIDYVLTSRQVFHTFDSATKKNVHWSFNHSAS